MLLPATVALVVVSLTLPKAVNWLAWVTAPALVWVEIIRADDWLSLDGAVTSLPEVTALKLAEPEAGYRPRRHRW